MSDSNSYSEFQLPTPTQQDPVVESSSKSSNEQTIEDNSTPLINQNSSHSNQILFQSNNPNYGAIQFPLGNICDSYKAVKRMPFTSSFRLKKFATNLYYGSNNFDSVLCFRYISSIFNMTLNRNEIEKADLLIKFASVMQVIFPTFSSLPYSFKPYYFLFGKEIFIPVRDYIKAPLYFLFTSLSYLMRGVESGNVEILKQLIKMTCERLFTSKFLIERWSFLIQTLLHYGISVTPSVRRDVKLRYDILTVSFIYNEMKFGNDTKDFFKSIWITSNQDNYRKRNTIRLNGDKLLVIPSRKEKSMGSFERGTRKLYQLKFTELLFKEWDSIDDLLIEYSQLKNDFYSIPTDFRFHTFNRKQFELLKEALERICFLPILVSTIELPIFSTFLLELNYFTNFKCFIFMTDFNSLIDYGDPNDWNFFFISTVKIVERITSISKIFDTFYNCISAIPNKHNVLTETFGNQIISFEAIITFIIPYTRSNYSELINQQLNFDSLYSTLTNNNNNCNYDYFTCPLSNFQQLNRIAIGEFITELRETINSNNNEHINKIFFSVEYQKFRRLWSFIPPTLSESSAIEIKKQYLEYFEQFLILYSQ